MSETPTPGYSERSAVNADAMWAAGNAIQALQNGRYELGAGLAAIAARAQRAARTMPLQDTGHSAGIVQVPVVGQTRDESPRDLPTYGDTTTRLQVVPTDPDDRYSPETSRCRHTDTVPGDFCWKAIYLDPDGAVWTHVDPGVDVAHPATPHPVGERS